MAKEKKIKITQIKSPIGYKQKAKSDFKGFRLAKN